MAAYVLAVDQGTTSTRAILFRANTSIAIVAQQEFPQHFPADGEVEHEPIIRLVKMGMSDTAHVISSMCEFVAVVGIAPLNVAMIAMRSPQD